jgi:hypothetical protein
MRNPLYAMFERKKNWITLGLLSWMDFFAAGIGAATLSGESLQEAGQSLLVAAR